MWKTKIPVVCIDGRKEWRESFNRGKALSERGGESREGYTELMAHC